MRLLMIQHVAAEGPGLLQEVLEDKGWVLDIRRMDCPGTVLPADLDQHQAFIILGGPMGAYQEESYPYLQQVQLLVREALRRKIPTVGICLGAQLIAKALGAAVMPNRVKEIGWYHVSPTEQGRDSRMFANLPPKLAVFQWHGDTFELPEGALLLATGDSCHNQAFVVQNYIWGIQFHLEVTPAMIADWAELYKDELIDFAGPGAGSRLVHNSWCRWEGMQEWREQFLVNLLSLFSPGSNPE